MQKNCKQVDLEKCIYRREVCGSIEIYHSLPSDLTHRPQQRLQQKLPYFKKLSNPQCLTYNTSATQASANAARKMFGITKPSESETTSISQAKVRPLQSIKQTTNKPTLGGWDRQTEAIPTDFEAQIAQAFENVEHTLQHAGGKGWEEVYSVRTYTLEIDEEAIGLLAKYLKKYCPNHQPLLTGVAVKELAFGMKVEIEVVANVVGK